MSQVFLNFFAIDYLLSFHYRLKNMRISSLLCLQNLFNCLNCGDLGGEKAMYNIWSQLGQEVFKVPQDTMILEPCTSLMRAALDHIKTNRELFDQLTLADIEVAFYSFIISIRFIM